MLEIRRLRLLRELHVRGTISSVAEAIHQSPSSISQQLSQLEREAGVPLFRRVGRRLVLTSQAEILVRHTEIVLAQLERAESEVAASFREASGDVHIAVFQSAALALMPIALSMLAESHPLVRVTMTQREPETALEQTWARDFDLVVAEQYPGHAAPWYEGLDRHDLTSDRIELAVPLHGPLSAIADLDAAAVAPWVMEPQGAASRHWAEQRCRETGFEPDVRFATADLQAHLALVESGHAVALIPGLMRAHHEPRVRFVELDTGAMRTVFTAARSAASTSPAVKATRDALRRAARTLG